jgi:hypothetical protein
MSTKYTKELLEEAVSNSTSVAGVLRWLGLKQAGGTQSYIGKRIKHFGIDTSHFVGQAHNKGKSFPAKRKSYSEILIVKSEGSHKTKTSQIRRALIEYGIEHQCSECKVKPLWNGKILVLQVDHKDGDWLNNQVSNLRFLCPNCHSQTPNYSKKKTSLASVAKRDTRQV